MKSIIFFIISSLSFLLHFFWEYIQCLPFFIHEKIPPTNFAMIQATFGDVALTWISYSFIGLIKQDFGWIKNKWGGVEWSMIFISGAILSIGVELLALESGRWSYTEINPLIFGKISLIPILQLLILFPITFVFTKYILLKFNRKELL